MKERWDGGRSDGRLETKLGQSARQQARSCTRKREIDHEYELSY